MATKILTKYKPEMCEQIIELGMQGATQKAMWSALGISKSTADKWKKDNAEFAEAVSRATTESQAWWEREGIANLSNRTLQHQAVRGDDKGDVPRGLPRGQGQ